MSKWKVREYNAVRKAQEDSYTKDGVEKAPYRRVGITLLRVENTEDGSAFFKIRDDRTGITFDVFENKREDKKEGAKPPEPESQEVPDSEPTIQYPDDNINPDDIPF